MLSENEFRFFIGFTSLRFDPGGLFELAQTFVAKTGLGQERWNLPVGASLQCTAPDRRDVPSISSSPAVGGHIVYVGASDGYLYAVNLDSGAELSRTYLGSAIAASPALSGSGLWTATCDGRLVALAGTATGSDG